MRTNTVGVGLLSAMALVVGLGSVSVATADTSPDDRAGVLVRWEGHDRYQVSARVSNQYPVGIARIFVASGEVFTDALSGAPIAARQSAPILLTRSASLPKTVRDAIVRLKPGSPPRSLPRFMPNSPLSQRVPSRGGPARIATRLPQP